jgi:hypothetical protein
MSYIGRYLLCVAAAAYALIGCGVLPARADIFMLESGGRVDGEWLNREEQPATKYLVRTADGVTLTLPLAQVRETIRQSQAEIEYAKKAPAAADTVAAQWELAEWCRKCGLPRQRQTHLRRIVDLDPNHQQARYALGYQYLQGQWITRSDFRRQEGYEFYRGKWRTPQEIEILETQARTELAEKEWLARLRRWRRDLADPERAKAAYESLTAIKDPVAVRPLGEYFARERIRQVKMLYADILASINTTEAVAVLVDRTLGDLDEEVFHYCLDRLVQLQPPRAADPFVAALKDRSNHRVNRAAAALARLQDHSTISPLIDALITTHMRMMPGRPGTSADSTTTTFSDDGTLMKQGEGPQVVIVHVQNQPVLDALTRLTGVNFEFDQRAWRYWHAQEKIAREAAQPVVDARRQ